MLTNNNIKPITVMETKEGFAKGRLEYATLNSEIYKNLLKCDNGN